MMTTLINHAQVTRVNTVPFPQLPTLNSRSVAPRAAPSSNSSIVLVSLSLNYNSQSGKYLDDNFPETLQDLMPNYLYLERIALLNEVIGSIRNLRDNNPKTRTILVSIFAILSMLLLLLKLSTDELGIWFLMFTVIGGTVAWTFVRTFEYDRKIQDCLNLFNDADAQIQLTWSQKNANPPMFSVRWNNHIEPERQIIIRHVKKSEVIEFLPAYSARFSAIIDIQVLAQPVAEERQHDDERCPSYRTCAASGAGI